MSSSIKKELAIEIIKEELDIKIKINKKNQVAFNKLFHSLNNNTLEQLDNSTESSDAMKIMQHKLGKSQKDVDTLQSKYDEMVEKTTNIVNKKNTINMVSNSEISELEKKIISKGKESKQNKTKINEEEVTNSNIKKIFPSKIGEKGINKEVKVKHSNKNGNSYVYKTSVIILLLSILSLLLFNSFHKNKVKNNELILDNLSTLSKELHEYNEEIIEQQLIIKHIIEKVNNNNQLINNNIEKTNKNSSVIDKNFSKYKINLYKIKENEDTLSRFSYKLNNAIKSVNNVIIPALEKIVKRENRWYKQKEIKVKLLSLLISPFFYL